MYRKATYSQAVVCGMVAAAAIAVLVWRIVHG